jgi:hypothetical protein
MIARPLSDASCVVCFVPVRRNAAVSGITSGIMAASATAGALVGFGIRLGTPARVFNAIASILLGPEALAVYGFGAAPTLLGGLLHVGAMIACGLVYVSLVTRSNGRAISWAAIMSVATIAVAWFLARRFGVGPAVVLPLGNLLVLCVILAAALVIGMRLAQVRVYKD